MRSRLRSLDSKISFFAFADIITAVSGVLIFVALLLATDLGRPSGRSSQANSAIEQRLQETLAQQMEVDEQNHRLQGLFAAADSAPDVETLKAEIARLHSELSEEQKKEAALDGAMADSQAAIATRDKTLGLTDLKATVDNLIQEAKSIAGKDIEARDEMDGLEQKVASTESQLLKLRQRDGQVWLIPEKNMTTKEPILVTVAGTGITIDRFDHPDQRRQADAGGAGSLLQSYLGTANKLDQYVVFLVRPSGIALFQDLVQSARKTEFDVGFDALEEDRQVHFSTPPPIDEPVPLASASAVESANSTNSTSASPAKSSEPPHATSSNVPQHNESWWQKLLERIGL